MDAHYFYILVISLPSFMLGLWIGFLTGHESEKRGQACKPEKCETEEG